MSTYIVGDIQGCFDTFMNLLKKINFDTKKDQVYLLGDFLNRGPKSLEVMNFIFEHQNNIKVVLGNHEIYALGLYFEAKINKKPHSLDKLLNDKQAPKLFEFLRNQPLVLNLENNYFVHAGISVCLSIQEALDESHKISEMLKGDTIAEFLTDFYANSKLDKTKEAFASFIFIRMCKLDGHRDNNYTGAIKDAPGDLVPWFKLRNDQNINIFFGHWAAIGFLQYKNYFALDSGCGWGKSLSAYCLEEKKLIQVDNMDIKKSL